MNEKGRKSALSITFKPLVQFAGTLKSTLFDPLHAHSSFPLIQGDFHFIYQGISAYFVHMGYAEYPEYTQISIFFPLNPRSFDGMIK
jgi:hypothetical protein